MDKNFIFAILMTTLIVVFFSSPLYQKRFGKEIPVQPQIESTSPEKSETKTPTSPAIIKPDNSRQPISQPGSASDTSSDTTQTATSAEPTITQIDMPQAEEFLELENNVMIITVSNRGGVITKSLMKKFQGMDEESNPQLVSEGQSWYGGTFTDDTVVYDLKDILFNVIEKDNNKLTLKAEFSDGRAIIRSYEIRDNDYILAADDSLSGAWVNPEINYTFHGPINQTEEPIKTINIWPLSMFAGKKGAFNKVVFLGQGDRLTKERSGKEKSKRIYTNEGSQKIAADSKNIGVELFEGDLSWYAVRNKYFMAAAIPEETTLWTAETDYTYDGFQSWYDFTLTKKASEGSTNINIYMGPISFDTLKQTGNNLTELMEFSWSFIRPISIAFLWIVTKMRAVIPNWGIVLILFSLLIKLALAPLSHKSFVSMQKMSSLQPQINELKEKHKNNPQKIQQATMELYKKEGVNPFGGCLPVLLQMPVFFALYPVIDTSFELRQAMFIPHWIEDLSRPDPFYILPIAMGVSMFFQSKPTMGKDPNQKMMLYVMPVMMVVLFANFSAGLTLYWFMFNVFSYIQQSVLKPKKL